MPDILAYIAYGFYLALILVGGIAAVRCRNLVRALLGLILTLFGVFEKKRDEINAMVEKLRTWER